MSATTLSLNPSISSVPWTDSRLLVSLYLAYPLPLTPSTILSYFIVSHPGLAYAATHWIGSGRISLTGPFLYPALLLSLLHYLSPVVFLKVQSWVLSFS